MTGQIRFIFLFFLIHHPYCDGLNPFLYSSLKAKIGSMPYRKILGFSLFIVYKIVNKIKYWINVKSLMGTFFALLVPPPTHTPLKWRTTCTLLSNLSISSKAKLPPSLPITNLFYAHAIFASSPKLKRKHFKKVTPNISFLSHISVFISDPNISALRTFVLCFKGQIQM